MERRYLDAPWPLIGSLFKKGLEQAERRLLRKLIERRFGPLTAAVQKRLEDWPAERLEELGLKILDARSLQELGLEDC